MKQKTAMMELIEAHGEWVRAWELYEGKQLNRPPTADEFYKPFLEKEKEQIELAYDSGYIDGNKGNPSIYYNQTYLEEGK